jgi:hypothetical protein
MCVRVRFSSRTTPRIYDPATRTITLPSSVSPVHTVTAVRAVLAELAAPQPELGARCWCGEPIDLVPRVPEQRRNEQVIKHGA